MESGGLTSRCPCRKREPRTLAGTEGRGDEGRRPHRDAPCSSQRGHGLLAPWPVTPAPRMTVHFCGPSPRLRWDSRRVHGPDRRGAREGKAGPRPRWTERRCGLSQWSGNKGGNAVDGGRTPGGSHLSQPRRPLWTWGSGSQSKGHADCSGCRPGAQGTRQPPGTRSLANSDGAAGGRRTVGRTARVRVRDAPEQDTALAPGR